MLPILYDAWTSPRRVTSGFTNRDHSPRARLSRCSTSPAAHSLSAARRCSSSVPVVVVGRTVEPSVELHRRPCCTVRNPGSYSRPASFVRAPASHQPQPAPRGSWPPGLLVFFFSQGPTWTWACHRPRRLVSRFAALSALLPAHLGVLRVVGGCPSRASSTTAWPPLTGQRRPGTCKNSLLGTRASLQRTNPGSGLSRSSTRCCQPPPPSTQVRTALPDAPSPLDGDPARLPSRCPRSSRPTDSQISEPATACSPSLVRRRSIVSCYPLRPPPPSRTRAHIRPRERTSSHPARYGVLCAALLGSAPCALPHCCTNLLLGVPPAAGLDDRDPGKPRIQAA